MINLLTFKKQFSNQISLINYRDNAKSDSNRINRMFRMVFCRLTSRLQPEIAIIILNILFILFEFFLILFNLSNLQLPYDKLFCPIVGDVNINFDRHFGNKFLARRAHRFFQLFRRAFGFRRFAFENDLVVNDVDQFRRCSAYFFVQKMQSAF
jgi:hypothetical protein